MKRIFLIAALLNMLTFSIYAEQSWWEKTKEKINYSLQTVKDASQRAVEWIKSLFKKPDHK
ncbi:MAG: hypothetical protein M1114_02790 [Candidatus Dependentiae bacterium]|nr:hypothetical protein [Candidatus Dependentiae bacterium]